MAVRGVVVDPSGAVIRDAKVVSECEPKTAFTDESGGFQLLCPTLASKIGVSAGGFEPSELLLNGESAKVVLRPARGMQSTTVTATLLPQAVSETAQSITTIAAAQIGYSPQPTLDDALRNVAGFTLFRRSGSRFANPTSQGVSLRGVGASGASRALVLYDGVPLNDPFGGWVYWSRVDPDAVSSVEVLQGGGSDIYGDQALAGVVNVFPRVPRESLMLRSEGGSMGSLAESAIGGADLGQTHLSGFFDMETTDGYLLVPRDLRGSVDTPANARHATGELRVDGKWKGSDLFVRGSGFGERRHNGTPLQNNDTQLFQLVSGLNRQVVRGELIVRLDGSGQSYNQSFSAIAADRNSEALSRLQHVPAEQIGLRATWLRAFKAHAVSLGADVRRIRGFTQETILSSGVASSHVTAGGEQFYSGGFVQDTWRVFPKLMLGASLRVDAIHNYDASSETANVATPSLRVRMAFPERTDMSFDPRASAVFHPVEHVSVFATGYRSFRSPRLNELYRGFRLGNVLTLANPSLRPERLSGTDAGVAGDWNNVHARATFFFARVSDPIANVTLRSAPTLITRQRQNAGRLESRGLQLAVDAKLGRDWLIRGDYQFADARITAFAPNPQLAHKQVPQVPRHAFAAALLFNHERWSAALNGRMSGRQFDDDLNQFDLGGASSFDVYGARRWNDHFETFVAVENMLDARDLVARAPTPNVGMPFSVRGGVKIMIGREGVRAKAR